jgi:hypothetical protein
MGDKSEYIERHIEQQRRELVDNMVELEERVTRAVNWRSQVEERPMMMVGLAFGGGVLLSALLGGTSRPRNQPGWPAFQPEMPEDPRVSRRPLEDSGSTHRERTASATWENVKEALLGVAVARAGSALELLLPGFHEEYKKAQAGTGAVLRTAVR